MDVVYRNDEFEKKSGEEDEETTVVESSIDN